MSEKRKKENVVRIQYWQRMKERKGRKNKRVKKERKNESTRQNMSGIKEERMKERKRHKKERKKILEYANQKKERKNVNTIRIQYWKRKKDKFEEFVSTKEKYMAVRNKENVKQNWKSQWNREDKILKKWHR